ncbi:MAG: hypothetical protein IKL10_05880 [Clostridia bacterium]|nr:hypothetical protein [Clostridia bacterium]
MTEKIKYIVTVVISAVILFGLGSWFLLKEPAEYSESERRALSLLPEFSWGSVISGEFMKDFENASPDQFPLRDLFRSLKAYASEYIFNKKDNNKIFVADGHLSKLEYPMNDDMIDYAGEKFSFIYDKYIKDTDAEVFLSVIPDKNCFIAQDNGYLSFDYDEFSKKLSEKTPFAQYIDIKPLLSAEDYYTTDTHWKQENIVDIADKLCTEMGAPFNDTFKENKLNKPFYGVYYNQSGLHVPTDEIVYLTSDIIDGCTVTNYDAGKAVSYPVYDMKKTEGADLYEMFLSGTVAVSVIENPAAEEKRELILFRDSFGSSIVPLFISSYSKITVVDIRYIASGALTGLVDFKNADSVLFLYSTVLLNNSVAMK